MQYTSPSKSKNCAVLIQHCSGVRFVRFPPVVMEQIIFQKNCVVHSIEALRSIRVQDLDSAANKDCHCRHRGI